MTIRLSRVPLFVLILGLSQSSWAQRAIPDADQRLLYEIYKE